MFPTTLLILRATPYSRLVSPIFVRAVKSAPTPKKANSDEDDNAPIPYLTSGASQWRSKQSRQGGMENRLWYEPHVILGSLAVFLLYFTALREENDLDEEMSKSLYKRIPGLEEKQLENILAYNEEHNLETASIIGRLNELEQIKTADKMT